LTPEAFQPIRFGRFYETSGVKHLNHQCNGGGIRLKEVLRHVISQRQHIMEFTLDHPVDPRSGHRGRRPPEQTPA
jgi:hypothetical protein